MSLQGNSVFPPVSCPPTVVAIMGPSFCGSSLMNMMLDSHPGIFGAGEVYRILKADGKVYCSICLKSCPIWDNPTFRQGLTAASLYEECARRTGKPVVADSSKVVRHFADVKRAADVTGYVPVVLTKHPVRLAASYLANSVIPKKVGVEAYAREGWKALNRSEVTADLQGYIARLSDVYARAHAQAEKLATGRVHAVQYEYLVMETRRALEPVLNAAGLVWDDRILSYTNHEHHPVGGNAAAHYTVQRQSNPDRQRQRERKMLPEKLAYYKDRRGERWLDDKYQDFFSDEMIEAMMASRGYDTLCARMGYDRHVE